MPDKIKLSEIRAQYPQYADMNNDQLLIGLHKKFYSDIPAPQFYNSVDYDTERSDPTEGMNAAEKFGSGVLKSFLDVGRSAKRVANMVGVGDYDQAAAEEDDRIDAPLLKTGWGRAGNVTGDVVTSVIPALKGAQATVKGVQLATKALPKSLAILQGLGETAKVAAPYLGAAAGGAASSAMLSPEDMGGAAKVGAMMGPVGEVGGRVATGLYGGAKAVLEPLYQGGRERILKRTLETFAKDPQKARAAAQNPRELVPGYTPTLAEATMDPGLAQLQRSAQTMPEVASVMAGAKTDRLNAYRTHLDELAGNDGRMQFHTDMREGAAKELYGQAYGGGMPGMTPELEKEFARLMHRPSIKSAMAEARKLAEEKGLDLGANPAGSVEGLHWVKMALDDQIGAAKKAGQNTLVGLLKETQDALVAALQQGSPKYGEALATYAQMSKPINQMQVGKKLNETLFPAVNDMSEDAFRSTGNQYAKAVNREGAQTAKAATGLNSATLENVLDPAQLRSVQGISQDISRNTRAQELAAIPGSQTAQHMGARNVLRGVLGPLGMPESALDSTMMRVTSGLMSLPFKLTASKTEQMLGQALRDPKVAAALMSTKDDPLLLARVLQPYAAMYATQETMKR